MNKKVWFTGCQHYGHYNSKGIGIIDYKNRPFSNIKEHDECLIDNYNSIIKSDDDVFHLGDFALCQTREVQRIANILNGTKFLVLGNHDITITKNKDLFVGKDKPFKCIRTINNYIHNYAQPNINNKLIVMCHFPFRTWQSKHYQSWHIFSHSHGDLESLPGELTVDVSVDSIAKYLGGKQEDYRPIEFEELFIIITKIRSDGFIMNKGGSEDPLKNKCFKCSAKANNWIPMCDNCMPKIFPNSIKIK